MTTAFVIFLLVALALGMWADRLKARASTSLAERPRQDRW